MDANDLALLGTNLAEVGTDCISRQAAIDIAADLRDSITVDGYWAWTERLKKLPSAQPDCTDCKKHGGDWECDRKTCHKGMDTISRQDAIGATQNIGAPVIMDDHDPLIRKSAVKYVLSNLPSRQPMRKKGRWTIEDCHAATYKYCCSNCKAHHRARYDFCPSCGADMRGDPNE